MTKLENNNIKRIHVNKHIIASNRIHKRRQPPLSCKTAKSNIKGKEIIIHDDSDKPIAKVIYSPDKPLSCGAVVWIETKSNITIL